VPSGISIELHAPTSSTQKLKLIGKGTSSEHDLYIQFHLVYETKSCPLSLWLVHPSPAPSIPCLAWFHTQVPSLGWNLSLEGVWNGWHLLPRAPSSPLYAWYSKWHLTCMVWDNDNGGCRVDIGSRHYVLIIDTHIYAFAIPVFEWGKTGSAGACKYFLL
jgi:hypothetical protein